MDKGEVDSVWYDGGTLFWTQLLYHIIELSDDERKVCLIVSKDSETELNGLSINKGELAK